MIIKMEFGSGWRFVDGIRDVFGIEEIAEGQIDSLIDGADRALTNATMVKLVGYRDNGRSVAINTNRALYLCNDSGKTIERLN